MPPLPAPPPPLLPPSPPVFFNPLERKKKMKNKYKIFAAEPSPNPTSGNELELVLTDLTDDSSGRKHHGGSVGSSRGTTLPLRAGAECVSREQVGHEVPFSDRGMWAGIDRALCHVPALYQRGQRVTDYHATRQGAFRPDSSAKEATTAKTTDKVLRAGRQPGGRIRPGQPGGPRQQTKERETNLAESVAGAAESRLSNNQRVLSQLEDAQSGCQFPSTLIINVITKASFDWAQTPLELARHGRERYRKGKPVSVSWRCCPDAIRMGSYACARPCPWDSNASRFVYVRVGPYQCTPSGARGRGRGSRLTCTVTEVPQA
eukprot:4992254-Prymnesium_polylepis.1